MTNIQLWDSSGLIADGRKAVRRAQAGGAEKRRAGGAARQGFQTRIRRGRSPSGATEVVEESRCFF